MPATPVLHPPTRKVASGGIAGAVAVVALYLLHTFARFDPPPEVAGAITIIIGYLVSYFVPEYDEEAAEEGDSGDAQERGAR